MELARRRTAPLFFTFNCQRIFYPQQNVEGIITLEWKAFKIIFRLGKANV
jgi:hypothetical protein